MKVIGNNRHKGFVVAGDKKPDGKIVWKVRVKDSESSLDGKKFVVASIHDGIELSKGLNVDFLIGSIDGSEGEKVERAVDVALQKGQMSIKSKGKKEFFMRLVKFTILFVVCLLMVGCDKKPAKEKEKEKAEPNEAAAIEQRLGAAREDRGSGGFGAGGFGERAPGGRRRFDAASMLEMLDPNDLEKLKADFPNLDLNDPNAIRADPNAIQAIREIMRVRGGFGQMGGPGGFVPGGFGDRGPGDFGPGGFVPEPRDVNESVELNKPADVNEPMEKINLKDVEMKTIIEKISQWTGKVIHPVGELMSLKISVYSPKALPRSKALEEIWFALQEKGYTHVEEEGRIILKPSADAKFENIPVVTSEQSLSDFNDHPTQIVQKFFKLESYSPSQMATLISPLVDGDYGHISSDETSRNLIVIDTVGNLIRLEEMVKEFDKARAEEGILIEVFDIKYADPSELVTLINRIMGEESTTGLRTGSRSSRSSDFFRRPFPNPAPSLPTPQPAPSSSSSTSGKTDTRPSESGGSRSATVQRTGASTVSVSVTKVPTVLIPDIKGKRIIVKASASSMEQIRELIKQFDKEPTKEPETPFEMVPLKYASATEVATSVEDSLQKMSEEARLNVSITALEAQKQVVIRGSEADRNLVKELIKNIDKPIPALPSKTWQLKFLDIDELKTFLGEVYQVTDVSATRSFYSFGYSTRRQTTAEQIYVSTFPSRNEITVRASETTLEQIDELIKFMDQRMEPSLPTIIELDNTDPVKISEMLNELFASDAGTSTSARSIFDLMFGRSETAGKLIGFLAGKVMFMDVPDTKKIILMNKIPEYNEDIIEFVMTLDKAKLAEMPEVVQLKYANPWDIIELLNALFNEAGTSASIRRPEEELEYTIQSEEQITTTGQQQTTSSADYRPPWSQSGARTAVGEEMPISNVIGKVRFVPDSRSKSVLILAPSELMDDIKNLISQLDKPGKQVMIQAIVVEVDKSKLDSVGVQIASDPTSFGALGENSLKALTQITQEESHGSMTFGAAGTSGSNIALNTGASVNVLIDFLVKKANARIINKQTLWAGDAESAEFFKGEEIAFLASSTVSGTAGTVTQSYDWREIGMTLRVRPNITPEKNVDMKVDISLSQLSQDLVNTQPREPKTRATNTLIVKDGQTVLLASILSGEDSSIKRKVPGLGDLPLLGGLFRHNSSLKSRSELLVFITPTVIDEESNPEDVPEIKKAIEKMENVENHLDEVAEWLEKSE